MSKAVVDPTQSNEKVEFVPFYYVIDESGTILMCSFDKDECEYLRRETLDSGINCVGYTTKYPKKLRDHIVKTAVENMPDYCDQVETLED